MSTLDHQIRNVLQKESEGAECSVNFETVWEAFQLRRESPSVQHSMKRRLKFAALGLGAFMFLAGFAYTTYSVWGGALFDRTKSLTGPVSTLADPSVLESILSQPGVKTFNLTESRKLAEFPIHEPISLDGWNKIFSGGVVMPLHRYNVDEHGNKNYVGTTDLPLEYVDIYENAKGQRITVEQKYDEGMTKSWAKSHKLDDTWNGNVIHVMGKNTQVLSGFPGDYAYIVEGSWSDIDKTRIGTFLNVVVIHPSQNVVSTLVIDEYGGVDPSTLVNVAHMYLNAET